MLARRVAFFIIKAKFNQNHLFQSLEKVLCLPSSKKKKKKLKIPKIKDAQVV